MFVDIQQSLEVLSVVVYRQAKVYISIQDYGTICVTTFILRDGCMSCLHTFSSIIAGTSHVSWKASVLWSNLMGKTAPTSFTTRCLKEPLKGLLRIGTTQGSTDMYVSSWSKNSSDISIYCYPIITLQQVVVTLQYWTPFSAQTLEQRHLSARLHSSHVPAEICCEWLLDLEQ